MSGGSYGYTYSTVEDEYAGRMYDAELDLLIKDLVIVLHDVEWWKSGDICEGDYRETVAAFKKKWLGGGKCRSKRLEGIVNDKCRQLRAELLQMIMVTESQPEKQQKRRSES